MQTDDISKTFTERQPQKNEIIITTQPTKSLTSDRIGLPTSTTGVQVLKPEFISKTDLANPEAFNLRKFGIEEQALQTAISKPTGKLTTKEKLLIEAEKARLIFDSRSITNF